VTPDLSQSRKKKASSIVQETKKLTEILHRKIGDYPNREKQHLKQEIKGPKKLNATPILKCKDLRRYMQFIFKQNRLTFCDRIMKNRGVIVKKNTAAIPLRTSWNKPV